MCYKYFKLQSSFYGNSLGLIRQRKKFLFDQSMKGFIFFQCFSNNYDSKLVASGSLTVPKPEIHEVHSSSALCVLSPNNFAPLGRLGP